MNFDPATFRTTDQRLISGCDLSASGHLSFFELQMFRGSSLSLTIKLLLVTCEKTSAVAIYKKFGSSSMEEDDLPPLVGEDGEEINEPSQASSHSSPPDEAATGSARAQAEGRQGVQALESC